MSIATHVTVHAQDDQGNPLFDGHGNPIHGVVINPVKPFVRAYWIPGTIPNGTPVAVLAGGASVTLDFVIDDQGHFDWKYLIGESTGPYVLQFFDVGKNRELQNRPVHSSLIVGSAQRPFLLPEAYFFNVGDSQRNLRCKITDISGVSNTIRLSLHGRRFYHKDADPDVAEAMRKYFAGGEKPYSYFLTPLEGDPNTGLPPILPANGKLTLTLQSDAGADTELKKWMAVSTGDFTVNIFDRSKNKFLMNDVIPNSDIFGNAEFPFIPADSFLLERQKYLIFYLQDLSGNPNTVYIAAAGRRLQLIP
jgi:hypothetical protein